MSERPRLTRRGLLSASAAGTAGILGAQLLSPETAMAGARGLITKANPPKHPTLILLGTAGGPPVDYVRTGISSALVIEGKTYLVDCGRSSATQYLNAGLLFSSLTGIVITHLHADHIADYYNYFLFAGNVTNDSDDALSGPVWVYGPGPAGALPPPVKPPVTTLNPADPTPGIAAMTRYLNDGYAYSHNIFIRETAIRDVRDLQDVHDIVLPAGVGASALGNTAPAMEPFLVKEDDRVRITAILVPHGPVFPSYAYRFDTDAGSVVFSGDTRASDNVVRLARGADILVHEALDLEFYASLGIPAPLLEHFKEGHTLNTEVGVLAQRAGVGTLVLSHLVPSNPLWVSDRLYRRKARTGYDGHVIVGNDLDRIRIGRHALRR
jgi:ribonuclease BN (tRNA processing enzyme)